MAINPEKYKQHIVTTLSNTPEELAKEIEDAIRGWVADPKVDAACVILSKPIEIDELVQVALRLQDTHSWGLATGKIPSGNFPDELVSIALTRSIPYGDSTIPSEVLVLGPFAYFPKTRRTDCVAFEIFVGTPGVDPKTGQAPTRANLAHVRLPFATQHAFESAWKQSVEGRLASLGNKDDPRAKAKVSFVIPATVAAAHGCTP